MKLPLTILDIFSGIGGFSLGLERAGMKTIAFCEIEPFCQKLLKSHWPDVPVFSDICNLTVETFSKAGLERPNIIAGGFPCQDISCAGKQKGIEGKRSGLWKEFRRLIHEFKPDYAIIENVANLRSKGLSTVLYDLWQIGYDAEWHCIPASAVGAPHRRDRIWIIAYPNGKGKMVLHRANKALTKESRSKRDYDRRSRGDDCRQYQSTEDENVADSKGKRLQRHRRPEEVGTILTQGAFSLFRSTRGVEQWGNEPASIPRVKDGRLNPDWVEWLMGFPIGWTETGSRRQRLMGLGNAVIPQIPEIIGNHINATETWLTQQKTYNA